MNEDQTSPIPGDLLASNRERTMDRYLKIIQVLKNSHYTDEEKADLIKAVPCNVHSRAIQDVREMVDARLSADELLGHLPKLRSRTMRVVRTS